MTMGDQGDFVLDLAKDLFLEMLVLTAMDYDDVTVSARKIYPFESC